MQNTVLYGAQISAPQPIAPTTIRYCLYARKSSEAEERQALSVDSQVKEMLTIANRDGLEIVETYRESHSAKDCGMRPVFNQLINDLRAEKFNGVLVWHPDRLSRNAGDLGAIVDLLDQKKLVEIRTYSQRFTNNPNEKFLLMILGSQAKLENDNKSVNVKRGLKTIVEMGLWPAGAPTGYLNHPDRSMKCHVITDPQRSHLIRIMFEKVAYDKWSGRQLFKWLKDDVKFRTKYDKPLALSNIYTILRNSFYCGLIEYPKKSNKWYTGRHESIITQDLFKKVQERLDYMKHEIVIGKEFAFTKLIRCGICSSGVTAEEKHKNRKDGSVIKYVYYGCTKFNNKNCPNLYLREEDLIKQLLEIVDKMDLNVMGIKGKLEKEIERFNQFKNKVMGMTIEEQSKEKKPDIRTYAKYLLKEGTLHEKRELMQSFKSRLVLLNKRIVVED